MDRSEIAVLIGKTYKEDAIGQRIASETKREVFCGIGSISGSEKLEAGRNGITAEYKLSMFQPDYQGEESVEIAGRRYAVYRTYQARNDTMELYLEAKAGV